MLKFTRDQVFKALENRGNELTECQRYILELKYGLYGNNTSTLKVIGKMLNLSVKRIYQLEKEAEFIVEVKLRNYSKHKSVTAHHLKSDSNRNEIIKLYTERYEKGLDFYSGEKILKKWEK